MAESRQQGLYRSRNGVIFGVCKGIADYLDFSVTWMRIIVLGTALITTGWPVVIAYILAACLMKPEPIVPFESEEDQEFYNSYVSSRKMALHRLKRTFDALERRIRRMETIVTAKDYDWDRRLNEEQ